MFPNILSEQQQQLLPFVRSMQKEFYLVGGTAIALYLGHRMSIDFDLFTPKKVRRDRLATAMRDFELDFHLIYADAESFHVIANGVKLTFFQYPFAIPAKQPVFEGIRMPTLLDLAAMKAYALGRRAKWKDYVDLFYIIKFHHQLDLVVQRTQQLFGEVFSEKLFRQQLCYFNDIDYSEEVSFMHEIVPEEEIKTFLTNIVTQQL